MRNGGHVIKENFWGTFEARLADFDADLLMDDAEGFLAP